MSYPKIGTFRFHVHKQAKLHKLSHIDVEIVLFASEHDIITQGHVLRGLTDSNHTVVVSFKYLEARGFLRIHKEFIPGKSARQYVITPKGRRMVTDFQVSLFPNYTHV